MLKVTNCFKCDLCNDRRSIVNASGDVDNCKIMFIGEAPGSTEDRLGLPFVGKAGKFLDTLFRHFDINRERGIVITNVIRCRPPANRPPTLYEINSCFPYLEYEVEECKPKVIVALGNTSLRSIMGNSDAMISRFRGKYLIRKDTIFFFTYHPSYILKNKENAKIFNEFYNDMKFISKLYKLLM